MAEQERGDTENMAIRNSRGRFTKGHSGNRKGRPKGAKSLKTIVLGMARKRITATSGGRRRHVSALEAIVTRLVGDALKGDRHARTEFLRLWDRHSQEDAQPIIDAPLTADEEKLVAEILGRALGRGGENESQ